MTRFNILGRLINRLRQFEYRSWRAKSSKKTKT